MAGGKEWRRQVFQRGDGGGDAFAVRTAPPETVDLWVFAAEGNRTQDRKRFGEGWASSTAAGLQLAPRRE